MEPADRLVFTTLPWDGGACFATPRPYFERLQRDAARVGVPWPAQGLASLLGPALRDALRTSEAEGGARSQPEDTTPAGLLRVELSAKNGVRAVLRRLPPAPAEPWLAASSLAPWFGSRATGSKHGDWSAYREATASAKERGCAVGLLLRDGMLVDGCRCTPLVLRRPSACPDSHAGMQEVWMPSEGLGAVTSVTAALLAPLLKEGGFELRPGPALTVEDLHQAAEVLVIGTGVGVRRLCSLDGQPIGGSCDGKLLCQAREALRTLRRDGWSDEAATVAAAEGLAASSSFRRWSLPDSQNADWLAPALAEALRREGLWGAAAAHRGWAPDQLLLHSGGPRTDVAKTSLLAGPPTLRFRAHQHVRSNNNTGGDIEHSGSIQDANASHSSSSPSSPLVSRDQQLLSTTPPCTFSSDTDDTTDTTTPHNINADSHIFNNMKDNPSTRAKTNQCRSIGMNNNHINSNAEINGNGDVSSLRALEGHVPLLGSEAERPPLRWVAEAWTDKGWQASSAESAVVTAQNLAAALRDVAVVAAQLETDLIVGGPNRAEEAGLRPPIGGSSLAGLLGYGLVQWTEALQFRHAAVPGELQGVLYRIDRWLAHDRLEAALWLVAPEGDPWTEAVVRWLDENLTSLAPLCPEAASTSDWHGAGPISDIDDEAHMEAVRAVQRAIKAGQLYQLNFGRCWTGGLVESPWEVMLRLFRHNAAPFSGFLQLHDEDECLALCSCSPELLLEVSKDGTVSTCPIKGTCGRGATASEDEILRNSMVMSQKEVAEHLMLVDLERHDLARVCSAGSVRWQSWRVETFPRVQHMVSRVQGMLRPGMDSWDALAALFPGGSITGCPKTATIAGIDELEQRPRGSWTGSLGVADLWTGHGTWNILIRTVEARLRNPGAAEDQQQQQRQQQQQQHQVQRGLWEARVMAGGGLTIGSDPAAEVAEAKLKANRLLQVAFGKTGSEPPGVIDENPCSEGLHHHEIKALDRRSEGLLAALANEGVAPALVLGFWRVWSQGDDPLPLPSPGAKRILLVENLDSFSLNIANAYCKLGAEVVIVSGRGPASPSADQALLGVQPSHLLFGPGPGRPEASLLTMELARRALAGSLRLPVLGICLGHQALGLACGWQLVPSPLGAVHGVPVDIQHDGAGLFTGLPLPAQMTRYNSLVLQPPACSLEQGCEMKVTAWDETRTLVMAIQHARLPIFGVQFHPESAGSQSGHDLMQCFLLASPNLPDGS
ncbi:unnamed protein product [Polarella glacialis]|uniref:p-aminobenzoic acid synthase n=1 Tax=Polarella glacialis TaxID=89957 RepID=A0A813LPL4_POLGL|nr:unnamed protein product [Polarella glacialis]